MKKSAFQSLLLLLLCGAFCGFLTSCQNQTTATQETTPQKGPEPENPQNTKLVNIVVKSEPQKVDYEEGEQFSIYGLEIEGIYSDGSKSSISGYKTSIGNGIELDKAGKILINVEYEGLETSFYIYVTEKSNIQADSFFWGRWVRMDNGQEYEVLETKVLSNNVYSSVIASSENELQVKGLGSFEKQSDSVIVKDNIPYFRNGGANLDYSLKIVGFSNSTRAASTISTKGGIKGKGRSSKYTGFESEAYSDENGILNLKAPTANDLQTVSIEDGKDIVVIPGLKISNNGDFMGTVALVDKNQYNLKITGTISDEQKDDRYLYGNNSKSYDLKLTITNIGEVECSTSICTITPDDKELVLDSTDEDLSKSFTISTLPQNATKTININLHYGELSKPYIDTGININIYNPNTNQEWTDYIPLRFFKGTIPITVSAKSPETNLNAALNGFVIYPDGNNQFFSVPENQCRVIFVPAFGKGKPYKLVFSGATVTSTLSESTEMYYTVAPATITPKQIITTGTRDELAFYINFGGQNHLEENAFLVEDAFEAYLSKGEIDYYSIEADSEQYYTPTGKSWYSLSYENDMGEVPETVVVGEDAVLSSAYLPTLSYTGYDFLGWFDGNEKVTAGTYAIKKNTTLKAKWQLSVYPIKYNLDGGTNSSSNPSSFTIFTDTIILNNPVRKGYKFDGWYRVSDFSDTQVTSIEKGCTQPVTLFAKWNLITYSVSYELNGGTNDSSNVESYSIETKDLSLKNAVKDGHYFLGWYLNSNFDGEPLKQLPLGDSISITLYAKWIKAGWWKADNGNFVHDGKELKKTALVTGTSSFNKVKFGDDTWNSYYVGEKRYMKGSSIEDYTRIIYPFDIGQYEVTQEFYEEVMGINPSWCSTENIPAIAEENPVLRPVETVSWYDAIVFCNKLSLFMGLEPYYVLQDVNFATLEYDEIPTEYNEKWNNISFDPSKNGYRLPEYYEWEFAARGGDVNAEDWKYAFSGTQSATTFGDSYKADSNLDNYGWYENNLTETGSHEVGKKLPNRLNLYDMSGNVCEWCFTIINQEDDNGQSVLNRLAPGGSYFYEAYACCLSYRLMFSPESAGSAIGFRIMQTTDYEPYPVSPNEINFTSITSNSVKLNWNKVDYANTYAVFYSTENDISNVNYAGETSEFAFEITGLSKNTKYYFWVVSRNRAGQSYVDTGKQYSCTTELDNPGSGANETIQVQYPTYGGIEYNLPVNIALTVRFPVQNIPYLMENKTLITTKGSIITLTATKGFTSYSWYLNDEDLGEGKNVLELDTSALDIGSYPLLLVVTDSMGNYYSVASYIRIKN